MNNEEAIEVLRQELAKYRSRSYVDLCSLIDQTQRTVIQSAESGATYQIVIRVLWDGKRGGDIRVSGYIDDGGWRAFMPLCEDFITGPNNVISDGYF